MLNILYCYFSTVIDINPWHRYQPGMYVKMLSDLYLLDCLTSTLTNVTPFSLFITTCKGKRAISANDLCYVEMFNVNAIDAEKYIAYSTRQYVLY